MRGIATIIRGNTMKKNDWQVALEKNLKGAVHFDAVTRQIYSTDASMYQVQPRAVVFPRDEADMQGVMEIGRDHGIPVLPRGGGTALAGQSVNDAIILDCSRHMNHVLEVNTDEEWAWVQPGVVQDQLNGHLAPLGYGFGPDTSTSNRATIGGMAGNNSCGARSIIYGKTVDHVLQIKALLADGSLTQFGDMDDSALAVRGRENSLDGRIHRELMRIATDQKSEVEKHFPKIDRRVSGYNLDELLKPDGVNFARFMVGSEGTLAMIRALKVRIVKLPKHKALLIAHFKDKIAAVEADSLILSHKPSAMELVDDTIIDEARVSPALAGQVDFLEGHPGAIVIVEFYGDSPKEVADKVGRLAREMRKDKQGYAYVKALSQEEQTKVWNLRKAGLGLLMGRRIDEKPLPFVEDSAVDPLRLADYVKEFDAVVKKHGVTAGYYGHTSVGCLHIRPFLNLKKPADKVKLRSIFEEVVELVDKYGGTITGEHGDGRVRSWTIEKLFGKQLYQAFREVKSVFDPQNLLNPGNIVVPQDPLENLRWGKEIVHTPPINQDFSKDGGFSFALEMCNGNGQCRKLDAGVMCPSYQATRDDRHSTRGRSNALKGVLQGDLPPEYLTSHDMYEVMDLCLECKGCKTECPSKVDMAKFKYEFLYHYHKRHGVPLRSRLFGAIESINHWGSWAAPVSNLLLNLPFSGFGKQLMGIAPKRKLPSFASQTFSHWFHARAVRIRAEAKPLNGAMAPKQKRPQVVLFHDTFMEYNTPSLGRAAIEVLEYCGYEVVLPAKKCCARPMISKGLLEEGRGNARFNVQGLLPYAKKGIPILGVEPSCLLTLKEDYPDLLPGEDSQTVAKQCMTVDEFLYQLVKAGSLTFPTGPSNVRMLLHGHCHQKSLIGVAPTVAVLRAIPGAKVETINAGCCGMAGSFGYEKEHYEISKTIYQQRLGPAVQKAKPNDIIVADGMSCRQQIAHFSPRKATHLIEVLACAVRGNDLQALA